MVLTIDSHEKEDFYIEDEVIKDPNLYYKDYTPNPSDLIISRSDYANKLYGFWLGQCIANWTGLVTEMDKIGNIGEIKTGEFYTRKIGVSLINLIFGVMVSPVVYHLR